MNDVIGTIGISGGEGRILVEPSKCAFFSCPLGRTIDDSPIDAHEAKRIAYSVTDNSEQFKEMMRVIKGAAQNGSYFAARWTKMSKGEHMAICSRLMSLGFSVTSSLDDNNKSSISVQWNE